MNKTYARRRIKAEAQVLLAGNWLKIFFVAVIFALTTTLIVMLLPKRIPSVEEIINAGKDAIETLRLFIPKPFTMKHAASLAVTSLLYLFITSPFSIGICRFFLKVAAGERPKLSVVFSAYTSLKTVFSSIWLTLLVLFISVFWGAIFMLVPVAFTVAAVFTQSILIYYFSMILVFAAAVFAFLWNSRYIFASYILAEEDSRGAFASLRECIELMRGRTKECMILRASYFLWDFLSVRIFPLTYIYFALSGTVYAKYLFYLRGTTSFSEETAPPEM